MSKIYAVHLDLGRETLFVGKDVSGSIVKGTITKIVDNSCIQMNTNDFSWSIINDTILIYIDNGVKEQIWQAIPKWMCRIEYELENE